MQFKKIVPYKIKRLIPMLGLAGATFIVRKRTNPHPR